MNYRQNHRSQSQQENYPPLNVNYSQKRDKKYSYQQTEGIRNSPSLNEIDQLKKQLRQERQKVKALQARTIQQQCTVLKHLQVLQGKFHDLSGEKEILQGELSKMRSQNEWRSKYENLEAQHKHIKGVAESMIDMMRKCQGTDGDLHQAWRWIKRVVWEYQGIRKKALEWKEVYDQVTAAVALTDKQSS